MKITFRINLILYVIFILFCAANVVAKNSVFIVAKIENDVITNLDIINEKNYLTSLNNNLKDLPKNQLQVLAKNSLIKEKIKVIELSKYFDLKKDYDFMESIIFDLYSRLNFKNENEFKIYLSNFDVKLIDVKEKIKIETLWNELVFNKFKNQISVDKNKLTQDLKKSINNNKNEIQEYNLSEILFNLNTDEKLNEKYDLIINSINNTGFKNTANIYSLSDTSKFGGQIGWIKKIQLSEMIKNELNKIQVGELTQPIQTANGYLILQLNENRMIKKNIDYRFCILIVSIGILFRITVFTGFFLIGLSFLGDSLNKKFLFLEKIKFLIKDQKVPLILLIFLPLFIVSSIANPSFDGLNNVNPFNYLLEAIKSKVIIYSLIKQIPPWYYIFIIFIHKIILFS